MFYQDPTVCNSFQMDKVHVINHATYRRSTEVEAGLSFLHPHTGRGERDTRARTHRHTHTHTLRHKAGNDKKGKWGIYMFKI